MYIVMVLSEHALSLPVLQKHCKFCIFNLFWVLFKQRCTHRAFQVLFTTQSTDIHVACQDLFARAEHVMSPFNRALSWN